MTAPAFPITAFDQEELVILASGLVNTYGMRYERLSVMSFAQMSHLFKAPLVMLTAKTFTIRLIQLSSSTPQSHETAFHQTGFILSAFLVAMHSDRVFSPDIEAQEKSLLVASGNRVVQQFTTILEALIPVDGNTSSSLTPARLSELIVGFHENLAEFNRLFGAWREQDTLKLVQRILGALNLLLSSIFFFNVEKERIDMEHPMISAAYMQIDRLRNKLGQIGGEEELAKFDADVAEAMANRRMLFALRQEHGRAHPDALVGLSPIFDFVE